jgi:hypothetical protein
MSAIAAESVFAIDVDGDGDIDVLSASYSDDKIAWYENDGLENFTTHIITTSANGAWDVYAIDVDGDRDIDVLSASLHDNKIAWHENDGSENFTTHIITTSALVARSVFAIDVDGDRDIDVLSASGGNQVGQIAWYENDGLENFTTHVITNSVPGARTVYAIDVDGDRDIDVLSASMTDNKIAWYENLGNTGIVYLPSGPDNYGYSAFESNDLPELPEYEWIEICPDSGGNGTLVPFLHDDEFFHYPLPFDFQYYGEPFDSITISSNGWLGMGIVTEEDYSNSGIPNIDGPSPMIAPYWEDMSPQRTNSGGVWQYYDAVEHIYIIEFNHVPQYAPTGNFETYQTILYDPDHFPTISGDGRIKVQYKSMSAEVQSQGTIGIENRTENDGIQFLYDGIYDIHADVIESGTVILFTTPASVPDITITLTPTVTPIIIQPGGGNFGFNMEIQNTGSSVLTFDGWFDVMLPDSSVYGPIILRESISLNPGGTITRYMNQTVPSSAPAGDYVYFGKVGVHPNMVYSFDSFPFEKLAGEGSGSYSGGWVLFGWDDQDNVLMDLPTTYSLHQNYPNPFNPTTTIRYSIPNAARVTLSVYDISGRLVTTLVDGWRDAGAHEVTFDASDLVSGIYLYRLEAGDFSAAGKMALMK